MRRLTVRCSDLLIALLLGGCAAKSVEPAGFPGDPQSDWRDGQGRIVNEEVVDSYYGAKHCDTQTVVFLAMGWPPGKSASQVTRQRQYVRDADAKLPTEVLPGTLDLHAKRPAGARYSGFHTEKMQLWLSPQDSDQFAYIVMGDLVERWPKALRPIYCA